MTFLQKIFLTLCFTVLLPLTVSAQTYPNYQSLYVNDFADIIGAQSEKRIEAMLRDAKRDRDLEVTVVTINRRSDYGSSSSIATFATGLFNSWGVGNPDRNDGILILVSKEDREMRIALGSGYPARYDDRAKNVIDNYFLPYFRDGRYSSGIEAGTKETLKRLVLDYGPDNRPTLKSRIKNETTHISENARNGGLWAWILGALGLGGGGVGFKMFRRWQRFRPRICDTCGRKMRRLAETDEDAYLAQGEIVEEAIKSKDYDVWYCAYDERTRVEGYPKWFTGYATCPSCNYYTLHSKRRTLVAATTSSTGRAEVTYDCKNCDHHKVETVTIPKVSTSSSSSGGSSGGFSGGSSSGGGASGSW
ncbi:TPM domain-containing protein [Amylibacter sp. IMCC11727]|uniref:TPM domain-containing protein n=1 Tax=Amylibacter sp. IMCC11727 TaxID=3039851 RepID=UPI00244DCD02|nr:TPM domain-containing protein [Amylibacter sp. IMCC11727]WGI20899.1 TPM domain-containing protein [Amylibacter sp. IMCC11727]